MSTRQRYEDYIRARHRPAHARRRASVQAGFLLPSLQPGQRVLDLGCGPGSITVGLGEAVGPSGTVVGIDLDPGPAEVPLVTGDVGSLPFGDASFDAVFASALLQHLADPLAALVEARRVCRPGAVIGVADADWGGALRVPDDPLLERGQEILVALRAGTSPYIGRHLRGLLHEAGFADVTVRATGVGGGDSRSATGQAAFQASMFEAPEVIARAVEDGIASEDDLAAVAAAWRRWGEDPKAVWAGHWFEALGRVPPLNDVP